MVATCWRMASDDLSKLIKDLIARTEVLNQNRDAGQPPPFRYDNRGNAQSNSRVVPASPVDDSSFGGDPRNSYRELRRYLLDIGIDSRIFSFGTIPIPIALTESRKSMPTIAVDIGSLDNCFFFEMRKLIESGSYGEKVNSLVIMFRVFFEGSQDSSNFWVQAVMNHHRDAVLELNKVYRKIIPTLIASSWSQPTAGKEGSRVTYFEKRFVDVTAFKHEFNSMHSAFKTDGLRGNNIEAHS